MAACFHCLFCCDLEGLRGADSASAHGCSMQDIVAWLNESTYSLQGTVKRRTNTHAESFFRLHLTCELLPNVIRDISDSWNLPVNAALLLQGAFNIVTCQALKVYPWSSRLKRPVL